MRELAYVQTIKSLSPIPGADAIEKAEVLGWELVVRKGEFSVGDRCVYVEIDSLLPEIPPFEFLRSKNFRVKIIKLRGQISSGIAFPISILNDVDPSFDLSRVSIGDDVTEVLKITKYDPESALDVEPEQIKKSWLANKYSFYKWKLFGIKPVKKGNFPSDCPKTDEVRVQKMSGTLERNEGAPIYITEKVEGSSATFVYRQGGNWLARLLGQDGTFQVCSRNRIVYNSQKGNKPSHYLMNVSQRYNIHHELKKLNRNLAIQGEVIGPKIQANPYKVSEHELKVFLAYDIDKQEYLPFDQLVDLCKELKFDMVPLVGVSKLKNDVKHYVEASKGKSMLSPTILREGIVVRALDSSFSFKSINPEYLLKQG